MNKQTTSQEVKEFISQSLSIPINKIIEDACLFHDLNVDGDDEKEFLHAFSHKFNVNPAHFVLDDFFGDEGSPNPFVFIKEVFTKSNDKKFKRLEVRHLIEAVDNGIFKCS